MTRAPSPAAALLLALAACADFGAALDDCTAGGRCTPASSAAGGGGESPADFGPGDGGGGGGGGAEEGDSGVCVDTDGDGLGPGCAAPDCEPNDGQRPKQLPCRQGAHVCRSCPGASDQNTGSPSSPLLTIAQGMIHARALGAEVRVANRDRFRDTSYDEDLELTGGVAVIGGYYVEEDGGWSHPAAVPTTLRPSRLTGILFPPGAGRTTRLEYMRIQPIRDGGVGITIQSSSPTLRAVEVIDPPAATPVTVAVRVVTLDGGLKASPLLIDPVIAGGSGSVSSTGVHVVNAAIEIRGGKISGGLVGSGGVATAVRLENAPSSRVTGAELIGCQTTPSSVMGYPMCRGLHATADVAGIVLEGGTAYGCARGCPAGGEFIGVEVRCGEPWDGGAPLEVAGNLDLRGAQGSSNGGYGRAIRVFDGCGVSIHDNRLVVGADTASLVPFAIRCARTAGQPESHCKIARNTVVSHYVGAPTDAAAISCLGGCDEVVDNLLDSHGTGAFHTLHVELGAPLVARNRVNFSQSGQCSLGRSVLLVNTNARFENNFVRGPSCQNAIGLVHKVTLAGYSALVHSNTITGGDATATSAAFGIYAQGPAGMPSGRYWNNILSSGPAPTSPRSAICFEYSALPLEVKANLLHSEVVGLGVHTVLGWGNPTPTYLNVAQTNAQSWGGENVDGVASPGIAGWRDFRLAAGSRALDAGTLRGGGPTTDIDGDPRPREDAGYSPAIGADEP